VLLNDENIKKLQAGDTKTIARLISIVENDTEEAAQWLQTLAFTTNSSVVGITGAPGAGKSTMVNALLSQICSAGKRAAVLSVDPSSPFNYGAILGDRIRMAEHFLNPQVYIRSVASRGALGGLSTRIFEILDVLRASNFDYILVETVGIGQSEVDIAGLAQTKVVVVVPEGGDEVQTMKAGVMEIADIFVVNKCDRPQAAQFAKFLADVSHNRGALKEWQIPVLKTQADKAIGIEALLLAIDAHSAAQLNSNTHRLHMLCEKAYQLIVQKRMRGVSKPHIFQHLEKLHPDEDFNVYKWIDSIG
jgi:LAO/AO transport system kinase